MIHFTCRQCGRSLEVDDALGGREAACPFCGRVNMVPRRVVIPAGMPVARAAGESGGESSKGKVQSSNGRDRDVGFGANPATLARLGLPPGGATDEEVVVRTVHPVMFRARPDLAIILIAGLVGGLTGAVVLFVIAQRDGGGMSGMLPWSIGAGGIALASAAWWGVWKVKSMTVTLVLTNKRAIARRGLLSRTSLEAVYDRIQDIEITQTFWQRMTGTGTLGLDTSAEDGTEIEVEGVPDPVGLRAVIDAYRGL